MKETFHFNRLPPVVAVNLDARRSRIVDYWNALSVCDDSGGTSWDVLDDIRTKVTELLSTGQPDDLTKAERLTGKAEFLRRGGGG